MFNIAFVSYFFLFFEINPGHLAAHYKFPGFIAINEANTLQ